MRFYSDQLNKIFNSIDELEKAEAEENCKKAEVENIIKCASKHFDKAFDELRKGIELIDKNEDKLNEEDVINLMNNVLSKIMSFKFFI